MIGGTFEYLMSSLPNLTFRNTEEVQQRVLGLLRQYAGETADASSPVQQLDRVAQPFLPPAAFAIFQKISLDNLHEAVFRDQQNPLLAAYSSFSRELKLAIRAWRSARNGGEQPTAANDLSAILGTGTPLEQEVRLLHYQWDTLEELAVDHFADVAALFTYKIKLMILLRWWSFDREEGWERFREATTTN